MARNSWGSNDADALKAPQLEQVLVTGDQKVGLARQCTFQDGVVVGVSRNQRAASLRADQLATLQEQALDTHDFLPSYAALITEIRAPDNLLDLCNNGWRHQK
jgi:hypothetical protein